MKKLFDNHFFYNSLFDTLEGVSNQTIISDNKLEIAVPGLTKEDIDIKIKNRLIEVSYDGDVTQTKKFVKPFNKTYYFSDGVDAEKISGSVINGILTINLPKINESPKERKLLLI